MAKRLVITLILIISSNMYANSDDPTDAANKFLEQLRTSQTQVFALAANSADSILCINSIKTLDPIQIQNTVSNCFINERLIQKIKNTPNSFTATNDLKNQFISKCTENKICDEKDFIFGGYKESCGHLGDYIDFLVRVKGLDKEIFTAEEGIALCRNIL